jgi:hypothetical protein
LPSTAIAIGLSPCELFGAERRCGSGLVPDDDGGAKTALELITKDQSSFAAVQQPQYQLNQNATLRG